MKYTEEDKLHFQTLCALFGEDNTQEYPFHLDDRTMDFVDVRKVKVYRNGVRRSIKVYPQSMQTLKGQSEVEAQIENEPQSPSKHSHNPLTMFIVNRWGDYVTKLQKQFILDVLEGNEEQYSKQLRFKYRSNIQKRMKMAFIGSGGDNLPVYKIAEYRTKLDIIYKFEEVGHDNDLYSALVLELLDKDYLYELVYTRLSESARMDIIKCHKFNGRIETRHLYEFSSLLYDDKEQFQLLGLA